MKKLVTLKIPNRGLGSWHETYWKGDRYFILMTHDLQVLSDSIKRCRQNSFPSVMRSRSNLIMIESYQILMSIADKLLCEHQEFFEGLGIRLSF